MRVGGIRSAIGYIVETNGESKVVKVSGFEHSLNGEQEWPPKMVKIKRLELSKEQKEELENEIRIP